MLCFFYLANILAVPFWVKLSKAIGKHRAYLLSFMILSCAHRSTCCSDKAIFGGCCQ